MDGERGSGAALRRRERRLRAWQRHVRTAVQLALAEKLHHSANKVEPHDALRGQNKRAGREEVENATHDGLRAQKSPPPGVRPGRLSEPVPQGFWPGAPRQPGSGAPSLFTPALADTTADGVDAGALAFLTRAAVEAQEEEARRVQLAQAKAERREQRVRRQEMVDELAELLRASLPSQRTPSVERRISELRSSVEASSSSMPSMRRRKKRKKRRKPQWRGSSRT